MHKGMGDKIRSTFSVTFSLNCFLWTTYNKQIPITFDKNKQ